MPRLTNVQLQAMDRQRKEKPYKKYDERGLFILVPPKGRLCWRFRYHIGTGENIVALGTYPDVSLKNARETRDKYRGMLQDGIDPAAYKREMKERLIAGRRGNTLEDIAKDWIHSHFEGLSESYTLRVKSLFRRFVFPCIGRIPVSQITQKDVAQVADVLVARGLREDAHNTIRLIKSVLEHATIRGLVPYTRVAFSGIHRLIPKRGPVKHRAFPKNEQRVGELIRGIDAYRGTIVRYALNLLALTFARPGEVARAEWKEFDFSRHEWRIPASRMKKRREHIVPLSRQAISLLLEWRQLSYDGPYLFRTPSSTRPISNAGLQSAIQSMGFTSEEIVPHGFRGLASTWLNSQGYRPDWIEKQLAHEDRNATRAAYNAADYLPERRQMMQAWADYLDTLRTPPFQR